MTHTNAGCEGCKFLLRQDFGYSNYTVTDTELACLREANPHMPIDGDIQSPKLEAALKHGETCAQRVAGYGPWLDVDGEVTAEEYKDDPDLYALLRAYLK